MKLNEDQICGRCGLYGKCRSHKIPARRLHKPSATALKGKKPKKILGIFMNPGKDEDRDNRILIGKAGRLTEDLVDSHWSEFEVWATNPVKCFHNPVSGETVKSEYIQACNKYLIEDILRVDPTLIVLHGSVAKEAYEYIFTLYDKSVEHYLALKTDKRREELKEEQEWYDQAVMKIRTIPVEHTVHPASTFYGMPEYELDNIYIRVKERLTKGLRKVPYTNNIEKVLKHIDSTKEFGFDTEWNPKTNEMHTLGISSHKSCFSLPFKKGLPILKKLLGNKQYTCIGFNLVSDISMLMHMGMNVKSFKCKFLDALILRRELMPEAFKTELKETFAYKYLMIEKYWEGITKESFEDGYNDGMGYYCAGDAWTSIETAIFLKEDYAPEYDRMVRARQIDMNLILPVAHMNYKGIKLATDKLHKYRAEMQIIRDDLLTKLESYNINPRSTKQLLPFLKSRGHDVNKTDKETLLKLEGDEFVTDLLEFRKYDKTFNTYFDTLEKIADKDSIVHINLNIAGAVTGRFTSSNPNMQNQPKKYKDIFTTKFGKDGKIKSMDGDQQEFRVYTYFARYDELIQMYKEGGDIHTWTRNKLKLSERRPAKNTNFGFIFGAGQDKLVKQLVMAGMKEPEANTLVKDYMQIMAPVRKFQRSVWDTVKRDGEIVSPYGRRGAILEYTNAINFPVQSFASDINKERTIWMFNEMITADMISHLWLEFHDENDFDVYKEEEEQLDKMIEACYEELKYIPDVYNYGIHLEIPLEVKDHGRYWSE